MGPFSWNKDGNHYLLITIDLFSKWVETHTVPLLCSWRAAEFLYDDLVTHWGKPCYIKTDNGVEFVAALHGSIKGWESSTTTSLLVIAKPMGR